MIRLQKKTLPLDVLKKLKEYQERVNQAGDYEARVKDAAKRFRRHNNKTNKVFKVVRRLLNEMNPGVLRCAYCEDSVGDEVEHIKPKSLYPEDVFNWSNYLYACGRCNGPKNNKWAVFSQQDGKLTTVQRGRNDPIKPPLSGKSVFINPRAEDPFNFLMLDLRDTFEFVALGAEGSQEHQRANYTIQVLGLNDRDDLAVQREYAYQAFLALLKLYIEQMGANASSEELDRISKALVNHQHLTVWKEMIRQRNKLPRLRELFDQVPNAIEWL